MNIRRPSMAKVLAVVIVSLSAVGAGCSSSPPAAGGSTSTASNGSSGAQQQGGGEGVNAQAASHLADDPPTSEPATCGGAACAEAAPATHAPLQEEQVHVNGTDVLASRITSEVEAPFEVMAAILNDFESYKTFLPQVSDSRVVQRRHGEVDVYLNIVLLRGLGNLWSMSTFRTLRAPEQVIMDGHVTQGNMRRFDSRLEVTPVPGTRRTRLVVQLLGVPSFPFPTSVLTNQQPYWTRLTFLALRSRAERMAAGQIPMPRTYVAPSASASASAASDGGPVDAGVTTAASPDAAAH